MLTVITDLKTTSSCIIFLPEHKITDELSYSSTYKLFLDILTALTSLVELKQWKTIMEKTAHTL
jgi:hypothetical protein